MNDKESNIDGRSLRSIITRKKLLDASRELFYEIGFEKTTISQIIKRAKTGYGTAYVHFKGKDDILIMLMETVMQEFLVMAETPFSPSTKEEAKQLVIKQVTAFLNMAESNKKIMEVFSEAISLSPSVNSKWNEIRQANIHFITKDITYAQNNGLARTDLKAELVARFWFFANENYQWDIVRNVNTATIEEIAWTLTTMYIDGLYLN
ncbi:TetR/AcrR family transcriptional regulator [Sporosarcina sp. ANT_H38]|uniref:TetR/AcrR family transcriptional regulator n=1 Tax=Sporosarcina sp. ANT_H38 TaxID=2597358 RepID=UPI0011F401A7|nr:TetR/AcrR family transcriptional regulator [Sporosarcina sp. ANT_H38]KAA0966281.1 TetR/AcrR family transcriptional regulator [Sporosarcina sp. ANT_H38]